MIRSLLTLSMAVPGPVFLLSASLQGIGPYKFISMSWDGPSRHLDRVLWAITKYGYLASYIV